MQLDPQLYAGAFWTVSRDVIGLGSPAYLATKQPLQQKRDKIMQRYNVKVKGLVERCSQSTHELDNQQYAKLQHRRALRMSIKCGSPTAYDVVLRTTDSTRDMVYEIHDLLEMRHAAAREQLIDGLIAITHEILFSDFGLLKVFSPSFVEDLPDTVLEKIWTGSLSQKASVAELEARIASLKKIHGAIDRMRDDLMVETDKGPASNADSPLETPHLSSAFSHSSVSSPKI